MSLEQAPLDSSNFDSKDSADLGTTLLPISRVKTIMKSSPDVSTISNESLFLIVKATELFVEELSKKTLQQSGTRNCVDYNFLAEIIDRQETLQFLQDIIPKKIKYKDYLKLVESNQIDFN